MRPGIVTQLAPLKVKLNGDTLDAPARSMSDFTGATVNVTEVLVESVEGTRFAWRVLA